MKRFLYFTILSFVFIFFSACSKGDSFYDDFKNGIDKSKWVIAHKVWGKNNGGVSYENVSYTKDGKLILFANGDYYKGNIKGRNDRSTRVGSAIYSKKLLGPGRYEVSARLSPRFGVCCAFWTYALIGEVNTEIDIEFGIENNFRKVMFSNWLTEKNYKTTRKTLPQYQNDGKFHKYSFEWHTTPIKKVEYYVDDVLYHTEYEKVPEYVANFWLGIWFPDGWAGKPDFERDFMEIDYVKYTDFPNQKRVLHKKNKGCKDEYYPKNFIDKPHRNLISNQYFHDALAWNISTGSIVKNNSVYLPYGSISQKIKYLFPNDSFTFYTYLKGQKAKLVFLGYNENNELVDSKEFNDIIIDKNQYKRVERSFKLSAIHHLDVQVFGEELYINYANLDFLR